MFTPRLGRYYIFLLVAVFIFGIFLYFYGSTYPAFIDYDTDWIVFANSISFAPDNLVLPVFGSGHGPLTAYLIKISGILFGNNAFGWRVFSILAGVLTIFICWGIYYLVMILKQANQTLKSFREKMERIDRAFSELKEKFSHSATYLSALSKGIADLMSFFKNRREKKQAGKK